MGVAYLASPYADQNPALRARRARRAANAAAQLLKHGALVFSPIAHGHAIAQQMPDFEIAPAQWLELDSAVLQHCDRLIVLRLPGWKTSLGVQAEIGWATRWGIPIEYLDPGENVVA